MFDLQEAEMHQWIREHLDDEEADEETPGWHELAQDGDISKKVNKSKANFLNGILLTHTRIFTGLFNIRFINFVI
ncbi:hypothetical protein ACT691_04245 [Vibrio metschnikovii]